MRQTIIISVLMVVSYNLLAQTAIDNVLTEVEKNNTTLSAYRKSIDAEKIGNKTGLTLQNPEVELNYLWGNPSVIGNRTDLSIKQSFDFPTVYGLKSQISDLKNEQAEQHYLKLRYEILYQTRVLCVKHTYCNALKVELGKRLTHARKVADAYKAKYNAGDVDILEYNKAQINLLNASKELENIEIERNAFLFELSLLNGGNNINFNDSLFWSQTVPTDFEQWFTQAAARNPNLQSVKHETIISSKEVKLNTAMSLPKFYGGYMSEKVAGEQFQGLTAGITVPIWENRNKGKYAEAKTIAMQSVEADARLQFYNSMKSTHTKVIAMQTNVADFRSKLVLFSNSELLEKAFNKGEISLTEYLYELSLYYESATRLLEMEMNLHLGYAELNKY